MTVNHSGHRERLRNALAEHGLMGFSPHEVIELMLYTALPRRDVNELAHALDERFHGVSGLMDAEYEELIAFGLSPHTAGVLRAYMNAARVYTLSASGEGERVTTRGDAERLLGRLKSDGAPKLILLSAGHELLCASDMPNDERAGFIAKSALMYDAAEALLMGINDDETNDIREKLSPLDIKVSRL